MPSASAPSLLARIIAYLFVALFCAAGPLLLLIAAVTGMERAVFIHSSQVADGVVVAFQYIRPSTNTSYAPAFRFTTGDGRSFTVTSNIAQRPSPWRAGDHVRVLYDPGNPENAHIDSLAQLWEPQIVMGIVGSGFSTIPVLILVRRRRAVWKAARRGAY